MDIRYICYDLKLLLFLICIQLFYSMFKIQKVYFNMYEITIRAYHYGWNKGQTYGRTDPKFLRGFAFNKYS